MSRTIGLLASSMLLVAPVAAHAGDVEPGTTQAGATAARSAAIAPAADQDFLEYLGSWDGSDEDWVVAGDAGRGRKPVPATPAKPATRGAASDPPASAGGDRPAANGVPDQAGSGQEQDK